MRMSHTVICDLTDFGCAIFSTLSQTEKIKKNIRYKMCFLIFSTNFSETFLILRRIEGDMTKIIYWSLCNVSFTFVRFQSIFCSDFRKLLN